MNEVNQSLINRDQLLKELKGNLQRANNRIKQYTDAKRREEQFLVGDWVYLKLQPYRQHSIFRRAHQKLASKYFGPFQVTAKVGAIAYCLALPVDSKIHPMFHVSLLKRKVGDTSNLTKILPPYSEEHGPMLEPLCILDYKWVKRGTKLYTKALVQWKNMAAEDVTWEDVEQLQQQFPAINLRDKVPLQGGRVMESHARVLESLNLILNTWLFLEIRITRVLLVCRRSCCKNLRSLNSNCFLSLSLIYLILSLNVEAVDYLNKRCRQ